MAMTVIAQVTGSMDCQPVNPALAGTGYILETTSHYDDGENTSFWIMVFSEVEAAFIPWGDFGANDTVLGSIAGTSFRR